MSMESMGHSNEQTLAHDLPRQTLSIGGGKGGVGRSLFAANLGIHLGRSGHRVALLDLDLPLERAARVCPDCVSVRNDPPFWRLVDRCIADRCHTELVYGFCPCCEAARSAKRESA